ncbi:MAG: phosphate ABC transporter ATP-binding protein [Dehalococcoidia bacterium]|jgi:tungstate transport system ATP-binding protein|nr:phosphate ABC transporter ATP-binding protein [Dehalococcoidia bacterium]MDP7240287.1 phosphate ABC transporter ATP-binding protein [Dehalococcoidia bacterium]
MSNTVYLLENVKKSYDSRVVCHISHLEIFKGEILGIMGPSGAGKSTLLRMLNFLEPTTSGVIRFNDLSVNGNGSVPMDVRRKVITVFQEPVLLSTSVRNNVAYGLWLRGQKGRGRLLEQALERVGLAHLSRARAQTLSGGEKQRVALARAMAVAPEVLLLDEPSANLDPYNVSLIEDLVTSINREQGTTIILVTHNVFQARRLSQRAMLMLEGRMVEVGETERLFTQPQDPRTLSFIRGEMVC